MNFGKRIVSGYGGLFIGLTVAGASLIGLGALIHAQPVSQMLVGIGGALVGAGFSHVVSNLRGQDALSEITKILESSLTSCFRSNEAELEQYHKQFYYYYKTEVAEGYVWTLAIIDFTRFIGAGQLENTFDIIGVDGVSYRYKAIGGVRDNRFILCLESSFGKESTSISMFPFMGKAFFSYHSGVVILESWKSTNLLSPCLISHSPLHKWDRAGMVDDETGMKLDETWNGSFLDQNKILLKTKI